MKKKLFAFFFLLSTLPTISFSDTGSLCNNKLNQEVVENIDNLKIKKIEVNIDNYRKWAKNSLEILIGNFRWIPQKYKKRFNAKILSYGLPR